MSALEESPYCTRAGFVYFVRDRGASGAIKIGFTDAVSHKRIMGIFQAMPNDLIWIGCYPANAREERNLHKRFIESRMKGEWFHPTEEVMSFILEKFPEYTELPQKSIELGTELREEIKATILSRYTLGAFYESLEEHGADVLLFRLWMFQKQRASTALLSAAREAVDDFNSSRSRKRSAA